MTIEQDSVKIEINCKAPDCRKPFIFDTEQYPPRLYCSKACRQRFSQQRFRRKQKDGSAGTEPGAAPEPHGDTPAS